MLWRLACVLVTAVIGVRVRSTADTEQKLLLQSQRTTKWTQCSWIGPEKSGFSVKFPMEIPKKASCKFSCERKRWELNSVMAKFFRADDHNAKCRCFLEGDKRAMFRFQEPSDDNDWFYRFSTAYGKCSPQECWARYQSIMNYRKKDDEQLSVHKQHNLLVDCKECTSEEDCPAQIELPTFLPDSTIRDATVVVLSPESPTTGESQDGNRSGKTAEIQRTKSQKELDDFIQQMGIELRPVKPTNAIVKAPSSDRIKEDEIVEVLDAEVETTTTTTTRQCPENCVDGSCSQLDGECLVGCNAGFFGSDCSKPCPDFSVKEQGCHRRTGVPEACDEIHFPAKNTKGDGFCKDCNEHCINNKCGSIDGVCADGCEEGFFGPSCQMECSSNCLGGCNRETGQCFKTKPKLPPKQNIAAECEVLIEQQASDSWTKRIMLAMQECGVEVNPDANQVLTPTPETVNGLCSSKCQALPGFTTELMDFDALKEKCSDPKFADLLKAHEPSIVGGTLLRDLWFGCQTTTTTTTTTTPKIYGTCTKVQLPSSCIINPGPNGDEWREQVMRNGCKGNVLVIETRRFSPMGLGIYGYPFGGYPFGGMQGISARRGIALGNIGVGMPILAMTQSSSHYIGLQVGSTYDIADMSRTVPGGLSISTDSKGDVIVQHNRVTLDVTLIGKAGNDTGLLAILDTSITKDFPNTQKLAISIPANGVNARWEYSQPPGLVKSLAQGVLSVGAWFGAKKVMPTSWVESIEYMPIERGVIEKPPSDWIVPCTHSSASDTSKTDPADEVPEYDNDDSCCDSEWNRDYLDDDESGQPTVTVDSSTSGADIGSHESSLSDAKENDSGGSWEYTPVYEGFDGWGDGGFGMEGHKTLLDY